MEYKVRPAEVGGRIDILVAGLYPQFTRSSLGLLFDRKMVLVNDKPARASYKVKQGDKLLVDETYLKQEPPSINLPILYEDKDVIVINKPAGILTHSKGALNLEPSVASFIKPKITNKSLSGNRAGIVHRLDRGTSGVIITAKTAKAQKSLQKQFSTRKVKKIYQAIAEGIIEPGSAIIEAPIARNPRKPQTFSVQAAGKPAITAYKTIKSFNKDGKHYTLVELEPKTGRTHQLRVHLAYIGHPIVGDHIYGRGEGNILLHAKSIELY